MTTPLTALALNCTLTPSPAESSTQLMADQVLTALDKLELSEMDDEGRPLTFGKVALVAVVGNEDGAHKITADLFQGLNDVGFTVPAQGGVYWNGEAMTTTDFKDLAETPEAVASAIATMTANATHLATLLKGSPYPPA
jgi:hypothetical protein